MSLSSGERPQSYCPAPLSKEQIDEAISLGKETLDSDPYSVWCPESSILLTIGTVFGQIAAMARHAAVKGVPLDMELVNALNERPELQAHYSVIMSSKHSRISLRRCTMTINAKGKLENVGPQQEMLKNIQVMPGAERSMFHQTAWFDMPFYPNDYEYFQIAVMKFIKLQYEYVKIPYPLK